MSLRESINRYRGATLIVAIIAVVLAVSNLIWRMQSDGGGETIYTEAGEIFPALQSVANSPSFMTEQPPANKQAILTEAGASDVGGFGYFPEWDELSGSIINPGLDLVWAGEVDAATATADICAQVDQFLADNSYPK